MTARVGAKPVAAKKKADAQHGRLVARLSLCLADDPRRASEDPADLPPVLAFSRGSLKAARSQKKGRCSTRKASCPMEPLSARAARDILTHSCPTSFVPVSRILPPTH